MITDLKRKPLENGKFIKTFSVEFSQNETPRRWECVSVHDSVAVLLYDAKKDAIVLVRQFRPSVWAYFDNANANLPENKNAIDLAHTYELCAGIMDKQKSEHQTAFEEVVEETGFEPLGLKRITSSFGALGFGANRQTLFFAQVSESRRLGSGGGVEDECIELCFLPRSEIPAFIKDESKIKASNLNFALSYFLVHFDELVEGDKCDKKEKNECVVVIDMQERILNAVEDGETVQIKTAKLLDLAQALGVRVFATEQVPQKLGFSDEWLSTWFSEDAVAKSEFSAFGVLREKLRGFERVVLAGIETHICVYFTALELLQNGFEVCVVSECVGSRKACDKALALENLRLRGVSVVSAETWAFGRLKSAENEAFRAVSKIVK